jgi:hypothetical protein
METVADIIDAVKSLTPAQRSDFFGRLREVGLGPEQVPLRPGPADYACEEFTQALTEHFHQAKRRVLDKG